MRSIQIENETWRWVYGRQDGYPIIRIWNPSNKMFTVKPSEISVSSCWCGGDCNSWDHKNPGTITPRDIKRYIVKTIFQHR